MEGNVAEARAAASRMRALNATLGSAWFVHQLPYYRLSFEALVRLGGVYDTFAGDRDAGIYEAQQHLVWENSVFQPEIAHLCSAAEFLALLLESEAQFALAQRTYEDELARRPLRLNLLLGAGDAARRAGNISAAIVHFSAAVNLVQRDTPRLQALPRIKGLS